MSCEHPDFVAHVAVNRLLDVAGFAADLTVKCSVCGQPMQFLGIPMGLSPNEPTTDPLGIEARLPMQPFERPAWETKEEHRRRTN